MAVNEDPGQLHQASIIRLPQAAANLAARVGHPHALLDALPAAIYVTDSVGRVTYYNEAAAAL